MRKIWTLVVAVSLAVPTLALADLSTQAIKKVKVAVAPNVSILSNGGQMESVAVQTGGVTVDVQYLVHANTQWVKLSTMATDLFKADDPNSIHSIALAKAAGVDVDILPDALGKVGSPYGPGSDWNLAYVSTCTENPVTPDGRTWTWACTETNTFESATNGAFSHPVILSYHWLQGNPELPKGEYSGWVKLLAATFIDP